MHKSVLLLMLLLLVSVKSEAQEIPRLLQRIDKCISLGELGWAVQKTDSAYSALTAKYFIDSINLRTQLIFQELGIPEWSIPDPDRTQIPENSKSLSELFSFSPEEAFTMNPQLAAFLKKSKQRYHDAQEVSSRIKMMDFVFPSDEWFLPVAEGQAFEINEKFAIELKRFQAWIQEKTADDLNEKTWSEVAEYYNRVDAAFLNTLPSVPTEFPISSSNPPVTLENGQVFPKSVGNRIIYLYDLKQRLHQMFKEIGFIEYQEIHYYQANNGLLVLLNLNSKQVKTEIEYLGVSTESNVITDFLIEVAEWIGARAKKSYSGQVLCSFSRICNVSTNAQAKLPIGFNTGLRDTNAAKETVFNELSCTILMYFRQRTSTYGNCETLRHSDASGFLRRICLLPRLEDQKCPKK